LSKNFGSLDWRPGLVKVGQKFKNPPTLRPHPRRTLNPNQKMFFLIETRRLAASVEGLNSSLATAAGELWPKNCRPLQWPARTLKGVNCLKITEKKRGPHKMPVRAARLSSWFKA